MSGIIVPIRVYAEPIVEEDQWTAVLEKINRHTLEPLKKEDVFTFSGVCSNDRLDSYMTKMDPVTTLKNYYEDLIRGVPLMDGHDIRKSPYGRSFDAEYQTSTETGSDTNAVRGHWYIIPGITVNGVPTNDEIRSIRGGIKKDMSVGFTDERYRCSSCGKDLFDWECPHMPGLEDENGRMTFAWVVDARLREVSTVYTGATPGAYIDKARAYFSQGQISQQNIIKLERQYQIRLDDGKRSIFMPKKEGNELNLLEQIRAALKDNTVEKARIYEVLQSEGETFRQPEDIAIRNELGDLAKPEAIRQLKKEAEMGRQYVSDLIDKAVQARVKVQGTEFDSEKYKQMLIRVNDVEFLKEELESYEKLAVEKFVPGRQTKPEDLDPYADSNSDSERSVTPQDENIFD
ncbi:hypothetical protein COJ96_10880 [Bacillus sp. AFS073361]|uniref:hypothetical protein n=1 Tax=Bacillus sp. AFS073361 TaxID=2033511 RepID=UPI000BF9B025|nr:hypothetical protein [Bacillus sp. AFS073361]PFP29400.1 hypothetical protein COJ96_10880 [Bacillus sp. AFS073361]